MPLALVRQTRQAGWYWVWRQQGKRLHCEGLVASRRLGEQVLLTLHRLAKNRAGIDSDGFWISWATMDAQHPGDIESLDDQESGALMQAWWDTWGHQAEHLELPLDCSLETCFAGQTAGPPAEVLELCPGEPLDPAGLAALVAWIRVSPLPIGLDLSQTEIQLPGGIARCLPDGCFADCQPLVRLALPFGIHHIGEAAFRGCSALRLVVASSQTASLGLDCFADCPALETVELPGELDEDQWIRQAGFKPGVALLWRRLVTHPDG
jgi:hypothetical protein